ncbi:MAG: type secretion system lysozyme-related protein [Myxococcales bacterium]|nr:type secretion system lysozyme-related protein [Myxococcales bacterium]
MAELTQKERLQPSLLDRLTDDDPASKVESRDKRVLSPARLRECVRRDLTWLLNTTHLQAVQPLDDYPTVAGSVLNYGMQDLTGLTLSSVDVPALERMLTLVIARYEPRLLKRSVKIRLIVDKDRMSHNAVVFDIEAELWAQPLPLRLFLRTEIDLESGRVAVAEGGG